MQENDFEKQMREQLNELNIVPSDAVWDKVSRRIAPRIIPWRKLWIPAAAIIIGLGFWMTTDNKQDGVAGNEGKLVAKNEQVQNKGEIQNNAQVHNNGEAHNNGQVIEESQAGNTNNQQHGGQENNVNDNKNSSEKLIAGRNAGMDRSERYPETNKDAHSENAGKNGNGGSNNEKLNNAVDILSSNSKDVAGNVSNSDMVGDSATLTQVSKTLLATRNDAISQNTDALVTNQLQPRIITNAATRPMAQNKSMTLPVDHLIVDNTKGNSSGKGDWVFGMNASFGVTIPATSVFNKPVAAPISYDNMVAQGLQGANSPYAAPPAYAPMPAASEPGANMGFTVGALVGKNVSEKVAITTGIQYAQQATSYSTGKFVNQTNYVMQNDGMNRQVANYYQNGSREPYTSRYHFAELPVDVSYAFAQHTKLPLFVHGGGTLGYLVSSNALIFSEVDGIYYKSLSELNRTQAEVQLGLNAQLMQSSSGRMLVGPLLKYNVTPIRGGTFNTKPDHLSYVGLRFSYYFK